VNAQITKLFVFIAILFAVLVARTSQWSVFDAQALKQKTANKRPLLEQQQIRRGRILASDGSVIARSVPKGNGASLRYVRRYPEGSLYGHPIGYSFVEQGDVEFEEYHNDELVGNDSEFKSILDELRGRKQEGNDIVTSIDSAAQKVALDELAAAGRGAVVAIEPKTGRVLVNASYPPYDPNRVPEHLAELNQDSSSPLFDRGTQGQYPPGSTFKVVTSAAALDSGTITADTLINSPGILSVEGHALHNDFDQDFGSIGLDTALTNSVNTYFAQLGQKVGEDTLFKYMNAFGFNSRPQIDLPSDQLSISGIFDGGKLLTSADPIDIGRVAIGQERLLATPLQMAEVASAVADGGKLMKPQIWDKVVDPDGRLTKRMEPSQISQPISSDTAAELNTAMQGVVSAGTGTNAAIPGVTVAGKTGTAETPFNDACGGGTDENQAWFIGFAPAEDPKVAIAASVECTPQFGNDVAAPIFSDVAQTILGGG
jgi:peptidoglycan glycosyltransferase